jgi:hypothetical protein
MPRFVVLEHDFPYLHWDFMLETGDALRTWRLAVPPQAGELIQARPLGNHRRAYLDYEGPLSGDRGRVKRWDEGTFDWLSDAADCVSIQLFGRRLRGRVMLEKLDEENWRFQLT